MAVSLDSARFALERHFGYRDFRAGQVDVVASVLAGRDTVGVLPTGGGKSLCYQVPALVLPGLTVVISPLISLMKDQVDRLTARGVAATYLNSTLDATESARRLQCAERGILTLLYMAPERLESVPLIQALQRCRLALLAVDEAHCISEWGHEFRPSFRRLADVRRQLGAPQTIALTATATPKVRRDIIRQLCLRDPAVVVAGFDRPNLAYVVRRCRSGERKERALVETLAARGGPSIVYASTRAAVEQIARRLRSKGTRAASYHGGLPADRRSVVQESFMRDEVDVIAATNAFGMGIDKPNVRLVVHFAMPGTLEAYYQEAGRAGRDGLPGRCVLLSAPDDRATHEWFIGATFPHRALVEKVYGALRGLAADGRVSADLAALGRHCGVSARGAASALSLLERSGVVDRRHRAEDPLRIRLLATPARIRRELSHAQRATELAVLRALWRVAGERLEMGAVVDLRAVAGLSPGSVRQSLDALRGSQFLDFISGPSITLTEPMTPFESLGIDWRALADRRRAEIAKLDEMEGYTRTTACRRAFLLGYFGERATRRFCGGCDNCHST